MPVDRGTSDHLIDEELILRLRKSMRDYNKLNDPKTILINGKRRIFATATGNIWGYIIDQAGKRAPVRISATFVPGLGRHVFSSMKAMQSRVSTVFETGNPTCSSTAQHFSSAHPTPRRQGVCSFDVFIRTLGNTADTSSTPAVVPAAQASNDANCTSNNSATTPAYPCSTPRR